MEDDSDTHICLRCRTTIVGLDEYVKHKKTECPALVTKPKTSDPVELATTLTSTIPALGDSNLKQESFFTLLELQSKNSPQKSSTTTATTSPTTSSTIPAPLIASQPPITLSELEFNKIELERANDENQGYEYILDPLLEHDDSEDELHHPPQTHTGGKWKPGLGPRANESHFSSTTETDNLTKWTSENGQDHDYFEYQSEKNETDKVDNLSNSSSSLFCEVCDQHLATKAAYDRHFNGHKHLKNVGKLEGIELEFNCEVCDRSLSSKFAYLRHVNSPYHQNKLRKTKKSVDNGVMKVRKSLRKMCKNKFLNDKMWKLDEVEEIVVEEEDKSDVSEQTAMDSTLDFTSNSTDLVSSVSLVCAPCKRTFQSKRNFAQHLLTTFHMKRTENNPERLELIFKHLDLLTKLAPFQCGICSYYFNDMDYFLEHWNSQVHLDNVATMIGPFLCIECECVCESNEEMLTHLTGDEHMELVETLDRKHPIIIKEKRSDLTCKECNCKFASAFALKKHEESAAHHKKVNGERGKKKYECSLCGWKAVSRASLDIHTRRRHGKERPFKCLPCNKDFADSGSLSAHQITQLHKRNVKLENEGEIATSMDQSISDVISTEEGLLLPKVEDTTPKEAESSEVFTCSTCNYFCHSATRLAFHQALHQQPEETEMSVRSKTSTNDVLPETENIEDGKPIGQIKTVKKYKCSYCEKMFPKASLLSHMHTHTGEKPYKCNVCTMGFAQRGTLYMHLRRHTGVKKYKCDLCSFAAEKPSRLRRHQEIHNANRPRSHLCDICGTGYHDRWALRHHMKVHYGKDHKCPFEGCSQAFRCPSELQLHVRVHTDERPFLCDKCGYRGRSQHQLTKHRRSHTGERPFKCAYCSYSAHLSPHLLRHMRIHTGAKPYKCPYCDYTCNTQENVRKHILKTKKHEGKKMYPCRFCDYTTNSAADYKTHVLDNHKSLVSSEETDVISLLAGVYSRRDNIKTAANPIPYVPRKERTKKAEKKKKNGRTRTDKEEETMVYAVQVPGSNTFDVMEAAAAEQILQCIETNQVDSVYLPVEHQIGEEVLISSKVGEEEVIVDESVSQRNITPETAQNTILIYVPIE